MNNARVIDVTTGEDLSADYTLRHRNQDVAFRSKVGTDKRHFTFTRMQELKEVTDSLSNVYCGYVLMLQPYIEWQTNILVNARQEPLDRKGMAKVLDVSERTTSNVLRKLKEADIISEGTTGIYRINERYHFRKKAGKDANALVKTFTATLKRYDLKPADLGFVYKLLPYVHYDTNFICADPTVSLPEDVRFLNEGQIADVVGMEPKKASACIDRLRKSGIVGTWLGDDKRERITVLNPYVFFRKNGLPDDTLRGLFGATEK